ncbi:MAG: DUF6263 family protein [Phycisphaerales bacterium]
MPSLTTAAPAFALALFALPCLGAEPVELVYLFDADAPVRYVTVQDSTQEQSIQGQNMTSDTSVTTHTTVRLLEANEDGSILLGNTTDRVEFSLNVPGMEVDYDSANPQDRAKLSNPTVASMAGTVGLDIHLLVASDGTILDVPNIGDLQKAVAAMEDPTAQAGAAAVTNKDTVMATQEMQFKLLPQEAVEPGDTWKREFKVPFPFGEMTTSFDLTLDSVEDGIASISITGSMSMPQIVEQQVTMTMSDAKVTGSMRFDIDDGVVDAMNMTTVMNMDGTMQGMPEPILSMTMTQRVKMNRVEE